MKSGIGGHHFPELDWIIDEMESDNTIIFCKTIALGFRVVTYLWNKARHIAHRDKRIRLYNSLNWPAYNSNTLAFLNNNTSASITIATDTLSVGWDSQYTRNAVLLGEPTDIDEFVQKIGRVGRDHKAVPHPRAFLYYSRTAMMTAQRLTSGAPHSQKSKSSQKSKGPDSDQSMDMSMARLLVAECKMKAISEPYNNPPVDIPCTCRSCLVNPSVSRQDGCTCSGPKCKPETPHVVANSRAPRTTPAIPRPRPGEGLTKELREYATQQLSCLRIELFRRGDPVKHIMLPPHAFLPNNVIKSLLDHLHLINNVADIKPLALKVRISTLREAKKTSTASTAPTVKETEVTVASDQGEMVELEESNIAGATKIRWRVNLS
ncbi:hypothetical protein H0H92_005537 [Tricholoma furcatifolium]|nr:hypothetical protein H0H92_005537 [Tricholoma furcatifolium]